MEKAIKNRQTISDLPAYASADICGHFIKDFFVYFYLSGKQYLFQFFLPVFLTSSSR